MEQSNDFFATKNFEAIDRDRFQARVQFFRRLMSVILFAILSFSVRAGAFAQENYTAVGSCIVVHVQLRDVSPELSRRCSSFPSKPGGAAAFIQMYRWAPIPLLFAFIEAERALTGRTGGVTGPGSVNIVIYPDGLINAGVMLENSAISSGGKIISINSGMIDFAEAISSAYMLDVLRGGPDEHAGLGLREWLRTLPPPPPTTTLANWAVQWPGATPPLTDRWIEQYIRTPAHSIYVFILAHELSHLTLRLPSGGASADQQLQREMTVDANAFHHLGISGPYRDTMQTRGQLQPTFIIALLAASARFERARAQVITGANYLSVTDIAPARSWITRGRALIEQWRKECTGRVDVAMCPNGVQRLYDDAEELLQLGDGLPMPANGRTRGLDNWLR